MVVVIVAILAAIAVPFYTNYLTRARRADAKTALEQMRASQEMFRAEQGFYANDAMVAGGNAMVTLQNSWGVPTIAGDYAITLIVQNANSFTAQAAPTTARQLPDGNLFIDQNGTKWDADGVFIPVENGQSDR